MRERSHSVSMSDVNLASGTNIRNQGKLGGGTGDIGGSTSNGGDGFGMQQMNQ